MESGWNFTPLWFLAGALILIEELGLARLMTRSAPERAKAWRRRGTAYDLSLVVLCVLSSSPLEGYSMDHLTAHMIIHIVEMFYIPVVLVLAAPWMPALFALPVGPRRRLLSTWQLGRTSALTRGVARVWSSPVFGLLVFNGLMVLWHLPRIFNWAMWHPWAHNWLMGPSFVIAGYLFWRVILPSHPYGPRGSTRLQLLAIAITAFTMLVVAMALAIFSHAAWYTMNVEMLGAGPALHDQQLGAAILWICGDFWAVPAVVLVVMRLIKEHGGAEAAFERSLGRLEPVEP
jgi:cytochrome c oxidase assembly factor CtaG